jgi:2-dehydropantoate 2-reductase
MRHAVLGVGGVGGRLAAALAHAGLDVLALMRPETLSRYSGRIQLDSAVLGSFELPVGASARLDRDVDVLWVTTKATHLEEALSAVPEPAAEDLLTIPLLNGIDHVPFLRERYPRVVAGTIRTETERFGVGRFRQLSPFIELQLAGAPGVAGDMRRAGLDCRVRDDEVTMLWEKLAFLAPIALATTAFGSPYGGVRDRRLFQSCREEVFAVADAEGARLDREELRRLGALLPDEMRSSMQKDLSAGRELELDTIAEPVLRCGRQHGIPVPATAVLTEQVRARVAAS